MSGPAEVQSRCNASVPNHAGGLPHRHGGCLPGDLEIMELAPFHPPFPLPPLKLLKSLWALVDLRTARRPQVITL